MNSPPFFVAALALGLAVGLIFSAIGTDNASRKRELAQQQQTVCTSRGFNLVAVHTTDGRIACVEMK